METLIIKKSDITPNGHYINGDIKNFNGNIILKSNLGVITFNSISATGNIIVHRGTSINVKNISIDGNILINGNITAKGNITTNGNITAIDITANDITAKGDITVNNIAVNGSITTEDNIITI